LNNEVKRFKFTMLKHRVKKTILNGRSAQALSTLVTLVTLLTLVTCSNPSSPRSRPQHTVSGRVSSSAVWQSGSDVLVSGRVQVDAGVVLTIQPDVNVRFEGERTNS